MNEYQRNIVLITGASSGIGKSAALLLDKMGYHVFAGVRTENAAEQLQRESSPKLSPLLLDITCQDHIENAFKMISEKIDSGYRFHALINNAGYTEAGPLEFLPVERLRYQLEVNMIGHFAITQKFLPLIRKSQGRIVNTGSPAGIFSSPFIGAYNISKHALTAFNDTLRRELHRWGIHVILLIPGFIDTPIWDKSYSEMDKLIENLPRDEMNRYGTAIINGRRFMDNKGRSRSISPDRVAESIYIAVKSNHPKSIYFAGPDSYLSFIIGRLIPAKIVDFVISMLLGGRLNRFL